MIWQQLSQNLIIPPVPPDGAAGVPRRRCRQLAAGRRLCQCRHWRPPVLTVWWWLLSESVTGAGTGRPSDSCWFTDGKYQSTKAKQLIVLTHLISLMCTGGGHFDHLHWTPVCGQNFRLLTRVCVRVFCTNLHRLTVFLSRLLFREIHYLHVRGNNQVAICRPHKEHCVCVFVCAFLQTKITCRN